MALQSLHSLHASALRNFYKSVLTYFWKLYCHTVTLLLTIFQQPEVVGRHGITTHPSHQAQGATGSETCIPCPRGTASQWIGAASLLTCEPCLPGLAADAGSIECSALDESDQLGGAALLVW